MCPRENMHNFTDMKTTGLPTMILSQQEGLHKDVINILDCYILHSTIIFEIFEMG